jgi:FkbM family methyltransferase
VSAVLDQVLERAFQANASPIRFIQIGGNDGVHEDPLYHHHAGGTLTCEWGQVFEPIPEYFELLSRNTRPFPYISCHQLAVDAAEVPGKREFNYVPLADIEKYRLPPSSKGIGSFSRDRNALGGVGYSEHKFNAIRGYIRTIDVDTIPIGQVVRLYGDANLLITDCEGHDLEIIRAAFAMPYFRPKVVQFEYLGHDDALLRQTADELSAAGYKISRAGKDVIGEAD